MKGGAGGFGGGGGGGGYANVGGFGGGRAGSGGYGSSGGGGGGGAGLGGALFSNAGTLTLTNDTFTNNTAGGGLGGAGGGTAAGVAGSAGMGLGGAVFVSNGSLTATFDTFSGNTANQGGTDVYVLSNGSGAQASASLVDDILGQTANTVSDFVANTNGGGTAPNLTGSSNDLVRVNPSTGGLTASAVVSSADPLLSPLAGNGGPTQTMALQAGSPAIGAGITVSGISTDQRGLMRPATPSLGAFDPLATSPTPNPPTPAPAPAATTAQLTGVTITPNLLNGTAQVTLTAQVNSPAGSINEGSVTFTFAGQSAQGSVQNGTASVQLTVSLLDVMSNQTVSLAYADNGPNAAFSADGATAGVALNLWNVLLPADVTFTPGGEIDAVQFFFAPIDILYANMQWTGFRYTPLDLQVAGIGGGQLRATTLDGTAWQMPMPNPQNQFGGASKLSSTLGG